MQEDKPSESALALRLKQSNRYVSLGLLAVLLLSLLGFIYLLSVKESESVAQTNQQVQSKIIIDSEVCKIYPDQELCILARTIAANPKEAIVPKDGQDGQHGRDGGNGADGRGISSFNSDSGSLIVTFTDNSTQDLGRIVGKDGDKGDKGEEGQSGRGIVSTDIVSGALIVSFDDGTSQNAGIIVGPRGENGTDGTNGENGTNGETGQTGPTGDPGLTPTSIDSDAFGNVTISYNDGSTAQAGKLMFPSVEIFECNADGTALTLKLTNGPASTIAMDCTPDNIPNVKPLA